MLSTSGHIAALVNPPGNEKATFRVNDELPEEPRRGSRARARRPAPGGTTGWRGWASARARRRPPARRSAAGATSRSATRRAATCSSRRAARPRQRRPAALRAQRGRRAAAADHRLHDQLGGVRARARPLRRGASSASPTTTAARAARGAPLRPTSMAELAADAAGLLRALGRRERARVRALDGRDDRPGARDPLPRAGARPGARRDHARRPARGAADAARARRAGRRRRRRLDATASAAGWASGCSPTSSGASSPSACASCCATSAATAPRRRASGRTGGRPSTTTRSSRLECIQAPTLVMHGEQRRDGADLQRAAAGRADPGRRAVRSCPAPDTPTCSSARRRPSSCSRDWLDRALPDRRRRARARAGRARRAAHAGRSGLPIGAAAHRREPRRRDDRQAPQREEAHVATDR